MELAEVAYASDETLAKVQRRATKRQPAASGPWANVKPGAVVLVGGKRFRPSAVEPTREGSRLAWLTGLYVTTAGKPAKGHLSHAHCPEGERMDLVNIDDVRIFI